MRAEERPAGVVRGSRTHWRCRTRRLRRRFRVQKIEEDDNHPRFVVDRCLNVEAGKMSGCPEIAKLGGDLGKRLGGILPRYPTVERGEAIRAVGLQQLRDGLGNREIRLVRGARRRTADARLRHGEPPRGRRGTRGGC